MQRNIHLARLMIPSQQEYPVRIAHLQQEKKCNDFNLRVRGLRNEHGMETTIDVVSHEQIVCVWQTASDSEQLDQITKLTVDIPTYGQGTMHRVDVGLLRQNLLCLCSTKGGEITLLQSTSTSGCDRS